MAIWGNLIHGRKFTTGAILLGLLLAPSLVRAQSTYSVSLVVSDMQWYYKDKSGNDEWICRITAVVDSDGVQIPQRSDFRYTWWYKSTGYWQSTPLDSTASFVTPDGMPGQRYDNKVVVQGSDFRDSAEVDDVGWDGTPQQVPVTLYVGGNVQSNDTLIYHFSYGYPDEYEADWNTPLEASMLVLSQNQDEYIKSQPQYLSSSETKFNYWNTSGEVDNFYTVFVDSNLTNLACHYVAVYGGPLVKDSLIGYATLTNDSVQFKDPWLVDSSDSRFYDNTYGYHNLGQAKPFLAGPSPLQITLSSKFVGVFENQNETFNPSLPIYSVRAPLIKEINGYAAFFAGWDTSGVSISDPGPQANGYDSIAVVFKSPNSTVTAKYSNSTVTYSSTIPAGTWPMAGSVTIPSGVTLTGSSGATMKFPSGATLVTNGALNGNGMTLTASSGTWRGITASTSGVSINNCTISSATSPIIMYSANVTVSGCTINNSDFSGGGSDSAAAIQVYSSSPTITNTTINGQSTSWSGVRFSTSSSGTLSNCTIQELGAGHGVILQGNSSPTITGNTIEHNCYVGIISSDDGTGVPTIESNTTDYNGSDGLAFYTSDAYLLEDAASNNNVGIYCGTGSQIWTGSQSVAGGITVTNNKYGIIANNNCVIDFGQYTGRWYVGTCNQIYGNTSYNAISEGSTGSTITADYDWWGQYPPDASKFYTQSGSSLDYTGALSSPLNCPISGGPVAQEVNQEGAVNSASPLPSGSDPTSLFQFAEQAGAEGEYPLAVAAYRTLLGDSISTELKVRALARLFNMFQLTRDTTIIADLQSASQSSGALGENGEVLLGYAYESTNKTSKAETTLNDVISKYPGTESEKQALILLASMRFFDPAVDQVSSTALSQLVTEYGSTMDKGELLALGYSSGGSQSAASPAAKSDSESVAASEPSLENYPNPFNPTTVISYKLSAGSNVTLKVYDILGRVVATLVDGEETAGPHEVVFDGSRFASGVYFYRLTTPTYSKVTKMLMLK